VSCVQSLQSVPFTNPRMATSKHRPGGASWQMPDFVKGVLIGTTILALLWLLL